MLNKLTFGDKKKQIVEKNIAENESSVSNNKNSEQVINDDEANLQLREEQLDIVKKWVKTGNVDIHKEVLTEEKNLTVPISREELVIQKKILGENSDGSIETIRIPIGEEQIDIAKHWVVLEDIKIYKNQFKDNKCIEETLKKEILHLETTGNPRITNVETSTTS